MRGLYQGILQVGVGLHHWRRGNFNGATALLEDGITRLGTFAPRCQGVDVAALIHDASAALETLLALGPERMGEYDFTSAPRVGLRA